MRKFVMPVDMLKIQGTFTVLSKYVIHFSS